MLMLQTASSTSGSWPRPPPKMKAEVNMIGELLVFSLDVLNLRMIVFKYMLFSLKLIFLVS